MWIVVAAYIELTYPWVTHRLFAFDPTFSCVECFKWCAFFFVVSPVIPAVAGHSCVAVRFFHLFFILICLFSFLLVSRVHQHDLIYFDHCDLHTMPWKMSIFRLFAEVLSTLKFVRLFVNMLALLCYIPRTDREFQIKESNKSYIVMMLCVLGAIRFIYVGSANRRVSSPILVLDSCVHFQWQESTLFTRKMEKTIPAVLTGMHA